MIDSIAFFLYAVSDVPRARRFYEGCLGLTMTHNFQDQWIEYDIGPCTLAIAAQDETHHAGVKGAAVAFEVRDLDTLIRDLRGKGVSVLKEPMDTPVCRFAIIADPDGNELLLHQRKSR